MTQKRRLPWGFEVEGFGVEEATPRAGDHRAGLGVGLTIGLVVEEIKRVEVRGLALRKAWDLAASEAVLQMAVAGARRHLALAQAAGTGDTASVASIVVLCDSVFCVCL